MFSGNPMVEIVDQENQKSKMHYLLLHHYAFLFLVLIMNLIINELYHKMFKWHGSVFFWTKRS